MRFLFVFLLMTSSLSASTVDDDFKMRVTWIKTLKQLFSEMERKEVYKLSQGERNFILHFRPIAQAWAETDSRYDCFYGGWPSIRKGGFCQNPARTNGNYDKGACKEGHLQCNPLLFGPDLCSPGATRAQRNRSFSNCENMFQKEKGGSYDFLKSLDPSEKQQFSDLSAAAGQICKNSTKQLSICRTILLKLGDGVKAIEAAPERAPPASENKAETQAPQAPVTTATNSDSSGTTNPEVCISCQGAGHGETVDEDEVSDLKSVATAGVDKIYQDIRESFLRSPFCDPQAVLSDPQERPSPIIVRKLLMEVESFHFIRNTSFINTNIYLNKLKRNFRISDSVLSQIRPLLTEIGGIRGQSTRRDSLLAQAKGLVVQSFFKNYQYDPEFMKDEVLDELVSKRIFRTDENSRPECPFISKDAFLKALAGRESVHRQIGGEINKKNQLTIVDYTRPSNERRMFVIDLKTKKVIHNTWVAHGAGGGDYRDGTDGLGGSAPMSNTPGSNLSSDGFILATRASSGPLFGPNVLLKGIDKNNDNLQSRDVIVHKWGSPYQGYSAGVQDYSDGTESYGTRYDIFEKIKTMDTSLTNSTDIERSLISLFKATSASDILGGTQGCLGVPENNIKHLDRRGRDTSQLEALREDLPGSLIFSYSGPRMSSKFF